MGNIGGANKKCFIVKGPDSKINYISKVPLQIVYGYKSFHI